MSSTGTPFVFHTPLGADRAPLTEIDQHYLSVIFTLFTLVIGAALSVWPLVRHAHAHYCSLAREAYAELARLGKNDA